jgi:hypothetical protein
MAVAPPAETPLDEITEFLASIPTAEQHPSTAHPCLNWRSSRYNRRRMNTQCEESCESIWPYLRANQRR